MALFRRLSLIAAASAALVGLAASPAQAGEFEASVYPVIVSGEAVEGSHVLAAGELKVTCASVELDGELPGQTETLMVSPTYSGCTSFGVSATVQANGCQYELVPGEEVEEDRFSGTVDIVCPEGQTATVVALAGKCKAEIGSQSGIASFAYQSDFEPEPADVTVEAEAKEISYTVTKDEFPCPFSGTGEKSDGALTGDALLTATFEAEAAEIAVVQGQTTRLCEEAPTGRSCPNGKDYAAGLEIFGTVSAMKPAEIGLYDAKYKLVTTVACEQSTFGAKTTQKVGAPLPVETVGATFADCKAYAGALTCETVSMENYPANGSIMASTRLRSPGIGYVRAPMAFKVLCGEDLTCEYSAPVVVMEIAGGKPPTLTALSSQMSKIKTDGESAACPVLARWSGSYTTSVYPSALWVTF